MEATQDRRRLILIIVVVVLLVCLVGVLLFNVFRNRGGGDDVAGGEPPTATVAPTEAPTEEPTEKATSTPTPVIEEEEPAPEPTEEVDSAAKEPTPTVPPTKTPTITADAGASTTVKMVEVEVTKIDEVLKNGDFEEGFGEDGVGQGWQSFKTGSAVINFSPETAEPFVHSGSSAQRISIDQAYEADQYGGIFQTVEVIPGKTYTVTLHGQIRSGFGSVEASSYGYRIQMAIDHAGTQFWRSVTTTNWIELPWPEQPLDSPAVTFSDYSLEIVPQSKIYNIFYQRVEQVAQCRIGRVHAGQYEHCWPRGNG